MEAKTKTFIKTSVDDNGMWLLTVPAGSAGNETVVVVVRRVEECRYGSEDSPGAYLWITCSLTLYGDGQSTPQTIVAKFEHGRVELFSVEFMLNEFLPRGRGVGSWIMQQMVLWTRSLPPETLVRQIHISSVDAKNIHNLIRRSRLWRGLGFRFPPGETSAMPLRAEKLSLPQSGDSDLEVAQRATGVIRLATLCSQSQEKIVELERDLASQSEYLLDLQTKLLSILWGKVANLTLFWGGVVIFLYFIKWMLVA